MTQQLPETAERPPVPGLGRHAAVVLAVTSATVFMVFLDATIVNVAFETISRDLHAGASRLAWVLNAYSLTFAATLIPAGRLADRYGRRRVFQAGAGQRPGPLMVAVLARVTGRLAGRVGFRPVLLAGAACWALAAATFALTIGPSAHWTTHWLPPALLTGAAIGLTLPVQSGAAVASLPPTRFGLGSAINASFRQLGAVLHCSSQLEFTTQQLWPQASSNAGPSPRI